MTDVSRAFERHGPLLAGIGALLLLLVITYVHGPMISLGGTPKDYAQAAVNLAEGNGYLYCSGQPISFYPPLYASMLAAFKFMGFSLIDSVRIVGAISAGVLAFSVAWLLRNFVRHSELVVLGVLITVLNPVVLRWQMELIADASHASAVMVCLAFLVAYLNAPSRKLFYLMVMSAAAAASIRFVGVAVIALVCGVLLLQASVVSFRQRFISSFIFGALSISPLVAFSIYNKLASGTMAGQRALILSSPLRHGYDFFEELSRWAFNLLGSGISDSLSPATKIGLTLCAIMAALLAAVWLTRRTDQGPSLLAVWSVPMYGIVYFLMMMLLASVIPLDDFSGRFILPIIFPAIVFIIVLLDCCIVLANSGRSFIRVVVTALLLGALFVPGKGALGLLSGQRLFGFDMATSSSVQNSTLLADVAEKMTKFEIFADDEYAQQFLLVHFGECFPRRQLDDAQKPSGKLALFRVNGFGLEDGSVYTARAGADGSAFMGLRESGGTLRTFGEILPLNPAP